MKRTAVAAMLLCCACARDLPPQIPEPWASEPVASWPQIVLTNDIRVGVQHHRGKGGAFLVASAGDTLAAATKHLLLALKGEQFQAVSFDGLDWRWTVYPRTSPADSVALSRLLNADPQEQLVKAYVVNRDWLVFELAGAAPAVQPLQLATAAPVPGQLVYLVGWSAAGSQQVYRGRVDYAFDYKVLIDFGDAEVGHLSGAPLLDEGGHLVGIYSGRIGSVSWINSTRYLREVLAQRATAAPQAGVGRSAPATGSASP